MTNKMNQKAILVYLLTVLSVIQVQRGEYTFTVGTASSNVIIKEHLKPKNLEHKVYEDRGFSSKNVLVLSDGVGGWNFPSSHAANLIVHAFAKEVLNQHDKLDAKTKPISPDFFYGQMFNSFNRYNETVLRRLNSVERINKEIIQNNPVIFKNMEFLKLSNKNNALFELGGAGTLLGAFLSQTKTNNPKLNIYQAGDSLFLIMYPKQMANGKFIYLPEVISDDMQKEFNAPSQIMTPLLASILDKTNQFCNAQVQADDDYKLYAFKKVLNNQVKKFTFKANKDMLIILGSDGLFDNLPLPLLTILVNIIITSTVGGQVDKNQINKLISTFLLKYKEKEKRRSVNVRNKLKQLTKDFEIHTDPNAYDDDLGQPLLCKIYAEFESQANEPRRYVNNFMSDRSSSRDPSIESDKGITMPKVNIMTNKRPTRDYLSDGKKRASSNDRDTPQKMNISRVKTGSVNNTKIRTGGQSVHRIVSNNSQRNVEIRANITKQGVQRKSASSPQKTSNIDNQKQKPVFIDLSTSFTKGNLLDQSDRDYSAFNKRQEKIIDYSKMNIQNPYITYHSSNERKVEADQFYHQKNQYDDDMDEFLKLEQLANQIALEEENQKITIDTKRSTIVNPYLQNNQGTSTKQRTKNAFAQYNNTFKLTDKRILAALNTQDLNNIFSCPLEDYIDVPVKSEKVFLNKLNLSDCLIDKLAEHAISQAEMGSIKYQVLSEFIAEATYLYSKDKEIKLSQFALKAKQFGLNWEGAKEDDITVIASGIKNRDSYDVEREKQAALNKLKEIEEETFKQLEIDLDNFLINTLPDPEFYLRK